MNGFEESKQDLQIIELEKNDVKGIIAVNNEGNNSLTTGQLEKFIDIQKTLNVATKVLAMFFIASTVITVLNTSKLLIIKTSYSVLSGLYYLLITGKGALFAVGLVFLLVLPAFNLMALYRATSGEAAGSAIAVTYLYKKFNILYVSIMILCVAILEAGVLKKVTLTSGVYIYLFVLLGLFYMTRKVLAQYGEMDHQFLDDMLNKKIASWKRYTRNVILFVMLIALVGAAGRMYYENKLDELMMDSNDMQVENSRSMYEFSVPSDSAARYYVVDEGGTKDMPSIITKRVGSSGTSYANRLFDCKNNKTKYLGSGDTMHEMHRSSPSPSMKPIVQSSIAYYTKKMACE